MSLLNKHNSWISLEDIEVLKHDFGLLSRWTDLYACKGKWKMDLELGENSKQIVNIYMPTGDWGGTHTNYFTVYQGRLEIVKNICAKGNESELRIWQNEDSPIALKFSETSTNINVTIIGTVITFVPKK